MRFSHQVSQIERAVGGSVPHPAVSQETASPEVAVGSRSATHWLCVQHHSGFGPQVRFGLRAAGFEVHWPRFVDRIPRKDDVLRPLFPGYMFAGFEPGQRWNEILQVARVVGLVGMREFGRPTSVPQRIVERLISRAGAIDLPIDETPEARSLRSRQRIDSGKVRICDGPFEGFEGLLRQDNGEARVRVLLEILGAEREVAISRSMVEPVQ